MPPHTATSPARSSAGVHSAPNSCSLSARFGRVRSATRRLAEPLEIEDYQLQSMPDASPVKWHLAHTSWFFETFLLAPNLPNYRPFHPDYCYLFNSYYEAVGSRHPRPHRGLLSRPTVREVAAYRAHVDEAMTNWLDRAGRALPADAAALVEIGLQHEQQHQELILTDLKHGFSVNPLLPTYAMAQADPGHPPHALNWVEFDGGLTDIGFDRAGFAFDNETPRHTVFLRPFRLASRPTTVGEYREFIADGGYRRADLWLSDGWAARTRHDWQSPLYWLNGDRAGSAFTLAGPRTLNPDEPVTHLSFYEADAFARWADARLPTEHEWERAAAGLDPTAGRFADDGSFHPRPAGRPGSTGLAQMFGDCWEWTASPYTAYPGYRPAAGAIGEYNGKFMCNQMVLRGGSCATPRGHVRETYRNFFPPEARWQFSGIRLARDV